jgi:polyisoprenoid-binding protein YceI
MTLLNFVGGGTRPRHQRIARWSVVNERRKSAHVVFVPLRFGPFIQSWGVLSEFPHQRTNPGRRSAFRTTSLLKELLMSDTTQAIADLTGDYLIDPAHTRIGFVARHAMVTKVRGSFTEIDGKVHLDEKNPSASSASIVIKVHSIDTGNADRDAHLRSNDFFAMEEFPEITFTSTSAEKLTDQDFKLTGDLTVKGVTNLVTIDFEYQGSAKDPFGNLRAGFEGKAQVNRKDFGVSFNAPLETGGVLVGDKITLEFDVSLIRS